MKNRNTHNLLKNWGRQKQQEVNNEPLKQIVFSKLDYRSQCRKKRPVSFWKVGFSFSAAVLAIFFVVNIFGGSSYNYPTVTHYSANESVSKNVITADDLGIQYASYTGLGSRQDPLASIRSKISRFMSSVPSTDTREFLKVGYNLNIKDRSVKKLSQKVQTTIRGYGGRIDSVNVNERYASIKYILPKKNLYNFKDELLGDINKRYISENTNSENLLTEKRAIESGTKQVSSTLGLLEQQKKNLISSHNFKVAELNNKISNYQYTLNSWYAEKTTSSERQKVINNNIYYYSNLINTTKKEVQNAINNYNSQIEKLNNSINQNNIKYTDLKNTDTSLMNEVETVSGYITVQWISVWDIFTIYIPMYKPLIVGLIIVLSILLIFLRPRSFSYID